MEQLKPEGGVSSLFEAFGFGALLLVYYLWTGPLDALVSSDEAKATIIGTNYVVLLTSFAIFICYTIGVFAKLFGETVYLLATKRVKGWPKRTDAHLLLDPSNHIDVEEFYRSRRVVEFFFGSLGVALIVTVAQITQMLIGFTITSRFAGLGASFLLVMSFLGAALNELKIVQVLLERKLD